MTDVALHTIEFCAGVGMLGEGLRAGLAHLGLAHRTVCYVEREAHAASVLVSRMQEGSLDEAPVWSDLLTFNSGAWRGRVDGIAAGFPCQDLSLAGKRAGLNGKRSGLFFNILDHADDSGAWFLFLENVTGIASATASVVDEASASDYAPKPNGEGFSDVGIEDGRLLERAAARVVGELADRGWHAEWLNLSAADVGANQGRARWFCFAWRRSVVDAQCAQRRPERFARAGGQQGHDGGRQQAHGRAGITNEVLGHAGLQLQQLQQRQDGTEPAGASRLLGNADQQRPHGSGPHGEQAGHPEPAQPGGQLAHAESNGRNEGRAESTGQQGGPDAAERSGALDNALGLGRGARGNDHAGNVRDLADAAGKRIELAHPHGTGSQGRRDHADAAGWQEPDGHARLEGGSLFAPGPTDPRWADIIANHPHLAPALEPDFRSVVNGLAFDMDDSRAARLKCVGNGVVALTAAAAAVVLIGRSEALLMFAPAEMQKEAA